MPNQAVEVAAMTRVVMAAATTRAAAATEAAATKKLPPAWPAAARRLLLQPCRTSLGVSGPRGFFIRCGLA